MYDSTIVANRLDMKCYRLSTFQSGVKGIFFAHDYKS